MKTKIILLISLISLSIYTDAQKKSSQVYKCPSFNIDETTKLITYTEVINQAGTSDELFDKGLSWYNSYFKNPTNVIRKKDKVNHKIVGKARLRILNPANKKGIKTMAGIVLYTITVAFKDGKYKYTIDDIILKQTSKYPIERWLATKGPYYNPKNNFYLQQVDENMKKTIADLKKHMTKSNAANNKSDW